MTTTTSPEPTTKTGSIAVYQRLLPSKRPAKVEVIRSVHESFRGPGGRAFGRTNNTVLLRVTSGADCLSADEVVTLGQCGLGDTEIAYVNRRLSELAGPARARTLEMNVDGAKAKLGWIVALAESTPLVAEQVGAFVRAAADQLVVGDDSDANLPQSDVVSPHELLRNALATLNHACEDAQSLYKRLPKGDLPDDVVLEFQKSWFAYQDLLATLTVRKSMARPAGWSTMRAQVCMGRIYRKRASNLDEPKGGMPMNSN